MTNNPRHAEPSEPDATEEFIRLLAACEQRLNGYILALVPNWADADEISQETKIRLWQQFGEYDRSKDFSAWAISIAHFQVLTHRKQAGRTNKRMSDQFVETIAKAATERSGAHDARKSALQLCLQRLSQEHRELIRRCYVGEQSVKDVAQQLDRSIRGTQQTVARIRSQLQECIERTLREEQVS